MAASVSLTIMEACSTMLRVKEKKTIVMIYTAGGYAHRTLLFQLKQKNLQRGQHELDLPLSHGYK